MSNRTAGPSFALLAATMLVSCLPETPPSQNSWSTWFVNLAIALGTVGAVVVALFLEPLRNWWFPPILKLCLRTHVDLGTDREKLESGGEHSTPLWWFHLQVSSGRRRLPVHGVRVALTSVQDAKGDALWEGDVAMVWALHAEHSRTIGPIALADLCALYKDRMTKEGERLGLVLELQPVRPTPYNLPRSVVADKPVTLTFQARGDETDSKVLQVRIAWDGKWGATEADMKRHLSVTEC